MIMRVLDLLFWGLFALMAGAGGIFTLLALYAFAIRAPLDAPLAAAGQPAFAISTFGCVAMLSVGSVRVVIEHAQKGGEADGQEETRGQEEAHGQT